MRGQEGRATVGILLGRLPMDRSEVRRERGPTGILLYPFAHDKIIVEEGSSG